MNDGKERRVTFSVLGTIVVILVYFFIFAEPLSAELSAVPQWKVALSVGDAGTALVHAELLAFAAGDRYGYFSPDGALAFIAEAKSGAPIADTSYVSPQSGKTSAVLRNSRGEEISKFTAAYPFYASGRLFSAEGDGTALTAYDEYGGKAWSYSFPCQLGAFSAGDELVVGGTVDGWLEGVDARGQNVFSFAPGGSRLPVVLGIGASRSGNWVAAVTGIDKQRLVVLGRGVKDYRVASHRYLESDFREPVRVLVMEDDRHVLYRRDDGIGVWAVDGSIDEVLPVRADTFDVALDDSRGIAYLVARRGRKSEIVAFRLPATLLGRIALPDSSEFVRFSGSSAYIGGRTWLARFDFWRTEVPKTILRSSILALAAVTVLALSATAFEWTADAGKFRFGFGTFRNGFLRGTEFGAAEGLVRSADDGELTFVATGPSLPGGYPIPGGTLLVISHESDMITVYQGLQRGSSSSYLKNVKAGDILGRSAIASNGRGVLFYTYDARARRFINPLILLPRIVDDKPPAIRSATLSLEGQEIFIDQAKPVRQGAYHLLLDAFDTSPSGAGGAPFEVRVLLDGSERARVVYDAAWAAGGRSLLFGATGLVEDSFQTADGRMRFGPFNLSSGRVILTIIVSDYAGNKREQTYSVSVQ